MTSNINDKMKDAIKQSTPNNNQSTKPINDANKKKDSINFNNVIKNLSTSPDTQPWYKKKASIIAMSSTLGVGALATVIAVPIVLTSQSASTNNPEDIVPPTPPEIQNPIDIFNEKPLVDKISTYNKLMTDNNASIINNFFNGGFYNLIKANANLNLLSSADQVIFNTFLTFINSPQSFNENISHLFGSGNNNTSLLKNVFLTIPTFVFGSETSNIHNDLLYFSLFLSTNNSGAAFYAIPVSGIENIEILYDSKNLLYSIKVTPLSKDSLNNLIPWTMLNMTPNGALPFSVIYNSSLLFNNATIFSGCSNYIKNNILNIV